MISVRHLASTVALACLILVAGCGDQSRSTPAPASTSSEPSTTAASPAAPTPPPAPPTAMSFDEAGAFVWHEANISPEDLGRQMRAAGFGWVAVFLHDGLAVDPVEGDWVRRFREASGLSVGGWGALRDHPAREAALADALLTRYGLDFYIADAEADYGYSGQGGPSEERYRRSRVFVDTFRRRRPDFPLGLSSYCRPDQHDLDWHAWAAAGAAFLPQAYVNDFGSSVAPAECVVAARAFFAPEAIHPTVGVYTGVRSTVTAGQYAALLALAGTHGFSVYLAETGMTPDVWRAFGDAIGTRRIAVRAR